MAYCSAGGYGGYSSGGYGGGGGGYGGGRAIGGGLAIGTGIAHSGGPVSAAIATRHSVEVIPVNVPQQQIQPQVIDIDSGDLPVILNFISRSSRVFAQQNHIPGEPGETQVSQSEDEPHRLTHEVVKPVIQEIREVITPYRRVVQEIRPVVEEVHTVVAKGEPRSLSGGYGGTYGGNYGRSYGGNYGGSYGGAYGGSGGLVLSSAGAGSGYESGLSKRTGSYKTLSSQGVSGVLTGTTAAKVLSLGSSSELTSDSASDGSVVATKSYKS